MKKFTKICLIVSLALVLIGGSICIVGAAAGGWKLVGRTWKEDFLHWREDGVSFAYHWDETEDSIADGLDDLSDDVHWETEHEYEEWEPESIPSDAVRLSEEYKDTGIESRDVKDLEINVGVAAVYLLESEDGNFGVKSKGERKYYCYLEDEKICLEGNTRHWTGQDNEEVYLYIPKGMTFGEAQISIGAGLIELGELRADDVEMAAGAGLITSEAIICRSLDMEIGAGRGALKGVETEELEILVGAGEASVEASVSQEIKGECGIGVIRLDLSNRESDYNYELTCSAGSIRLGEDTYSGLAREKYMDNNAQGECFLEASMGSIRVRFER